jgi:hypothetical protein
VLPYLESKSSYQAWFNAVLERVMKENEQFPEPLQYAEIKQISKSIAKWVWQRFSIEGKKEWHAKKGAKGGSKSKGGGRPSLGEPWKELGISRATYFRRKKSEK